MRSLWNIFTGKQRPGEWPLDILCCVIACSYGQDSFGLRSVPQPEAKNGASSRARVLQRDVASGCGVLRRRGCVVRSGRVYCRGQSNSAPDC